MPEPNRMENKAQAGLLPDAAERCRIEKDIAANFVVEAAAGSGKTTSLVKRLLTLARRGEIRPDKLVAAVTFTRKAAAELRERLACAIQGELDKATGPDRANLEAARLALRQCHIGTIHSFCGRLLRERPVEAGVNPDFLELEEEDDKAMQNKAWDIFASQALDSGDASLFAAFGELDMSLEDLRQGFPLYLDYPDVEAWPGSDVSVTVESVGDFCSALSGFADSVAVYDIDDGDAGSDTLLPLYHRLLLWARRLPEHAELAQAHPILSQFPNDPNVVQRSWQRFFGNDVKTRLSEEKERYLRFFENHVAPFRRRVRAARYALAFRCYRVAQTVYDRLRQEAGSLNFRDLLMKTAALLRDHPEVRRSLSQRFARLLVDEVQDTDPIQAEILFLLAGDDPEQTDWRRSRLRPGALFMVGDPKQSIYRFTRADIATYSLIKKLVTENGGTVLYLTVNFRSQPALVDWVNRTFQPGEESDVSRFPAAEQAVSPAYVPLLAATSRAGADCFSGVFRLPLLSTQRGGTKKNPDAVPIAKADVLADEAKRVASFIRSAVAGGMCLDDPRQGKKRVGYGDFLVLTRTKSGIGVIASALAAARIPARLTGGMAFALESAPRLLETALDAVLEPDNPVLQVACLRSALFGVSDEDLYRWKKAGGSFDRIAPLLSDRPSAVRDGLRFLSDCAALFQDHHPLTAFKLLAERLGIWILAGLGDDGDNVSGALLSIMDLLACDASALSTPAQLRERYASLVAGGVYETLPALGDSGQAVRVMNVHKSKGLEAPIVFLTGLRGKEHPVKIAIDRSGGRAVGRLALYRQMIQGQQLVACPEDWEQAETVEKEFLRAEELRLGYVAATRAGMAVVVSIAGGGKKALGSSMLNNIDIDADLPEQVQLPAAETVPKTEISPAVSIAEAIARQSAAVERIQVAAVPSYFLERAKEKNAKARQISLFAMPAVESAVFPHHGEGSEQAMAVGEILHEILESGETFDNAVLQAMLQRRLAERELPLALAGDLAEMVAAIWSSSLWARAVSARRIFRELPFVMRWEDENTLVRGVMDLVFEEADGWVIVDYKSDALGDRDPFRMAERHRGQLETYAAALRKLDKSVRVKEKGIYFLRARRYVAL